MTELGRFNTLPVLRLTPKGAVLDGGEDGDILLPSALVPEGTRKNALVDVFLYLDADDRIAATTQAPLAQVGEVAFLKVVSTNAAGAFLNWGLPKDLLMPWNEVKREQKRFVLQGRKVLVAVFQAEDGRVAASARLSDFLMERAEAFTEGQEVSILAAEPTDLGMRVVVNHRYWGLVHASDILGTFDRGEVRKGFVKALRPDKKLNIALTPPGMARIDSASQRILEALQARGGVLALTDKSEPEAIYALLGISKKAFKQAVGTLYKNRTIDLEAEGIRLVRK